MSENELDWLRWAVEWAAVGGGVAFVLFVQSRLFCRGARIARFAKRSGLRYAKEFDVSAHELDDIACLRIGARGRATNCFAGERGGRRFLVFDWHYELPGNHRSESRAYMPVLLMGWLTWLLLPWIDSASGPGFSIAVVLHGSRKVARGSEPRNSLTPLRAEFAENVSIVRSEDGLLASRDALAAVDRLNAVLDGATRAPVNS